MVWIIYHGYWPTIKPLVPDVLMIQLSLCGVRLIASVSGCPNAFSELSHSSDEKTLFSPLIFKLLSLSYLKRDWTSKCTFRDLVHLDMTGIYLPPPVIFHTDPQVILAAIAVNLVMASACQGYHTWALIEKDLLCSRLQVYILCTAGGKKKPLW